MRRIALTDMLRSSRSRLDALKPGRISLGTLKLGRISLGTLKPGSLRLPSLDRRGKAFAYAGATLALAGIGAGTAAAELGGAGPVSAAAASPAGIAAQARDLGIATTGFGDGSPAATAPSIRHLAAEAAAKPGSPAPVSIAPAAPGTTPAPAAPAAPAVPSASPSAGAADPTPAAPARAGHAQHAAHHARHAAHQARRPVHVVKHSAVSWQRVRDAIARDTLPRAKPGTLPMADRLQAGPAPGQQAYMPISGAQLANATTIVRQALHKHMGLRSAVVAVATAMQESTLQNITYGDRDSLGLFQQRPSMGWGSAKQITTPSYAADAFLGALAKYQHENPQWADQPLWATAQAVQRSGFPQAYAKWEAQAAQLVHTIAGHLL